MEKLYFLYIPKDTKNPSVNIVAIIDTVSGETFCNTSPVVL